LTKHPAGVRHWPTKEKLMQGNAMIYGNERKNERPSLKKKNEG